MKLVRQRMDVNEHWGLFNKTLKMQMKVKERRVYSFPISVTVTVEPSTMSILNKKQRYIQNQNPIVKRGKYVPLTHRSDFNENAAGIN